jgi:hypothetical protein
LYARDQLRIKDPDGRVVRAVAVFDANLNLFRQVALVAWVVEASLYIAVEAL